MELSCFESKNDLLSTIKLGLVDNSKIHYSVYLLKLLLVSDNEEYVDQYVPWMQACLKLLDSSKHRTLGFSTIAVILKRSVKHQQLNKDVTSSVIVKLLENILKYPKSECSLQCLELCLYNYPGTCSHQKNAIEEFFINFILKNEAISDGLARCFVLLPMISGAGPVASRWKTFFDKVVRTCDVTLCELFGNPAPQRLAGEDIFPVVDLNSKTADEKKKLLFMYTSNILLILRTALLNKFPAEKTISFVSVLDIISRGLMVKSLPGLDTILPNIYIKHLSVLDALVVVCSANIWPYASVIDKCLKHMLQVISSNESVPLGVAVYSSLGNWLNIIQDGFNIDEYKDCIYSVVLSDISIKRSTISLTVHKPSKYGKHKKSTTETPPEANDTCSERRCYAALKAIQRLLQHCGIFLTPETHEVLQEAVISTLLEIQRYSCLEEVPAPYSTPVCRKELYGALFSLIIENKNNGPSPLHFGISLFKKGINDVNKEIVETCVTSLAVIEKIIHPGFRSSAFLPISEAPKQKTVTLMRPEVAKSIVMTEENKTKTQDVVESDAASIDVETITSDEEGSDESSSVSLIMEEVRETNVAQDAEEIMEVDVKEDVIEGSNCLKNGSPVKNKGKGLVIERSPKKESPKKLLQGEIMVNNPDVIIIDSEQPEKIGEENTNTKLTRKSEERSGKTPVKRDEKSLDKNNETPTKLPSKTEERVDKTPNKRDEKSFENNKSPSRHSERVLNKDSKTEMYTESEKVRKEDTPTKLPKESQEKGDKTPTKRGEKSSEENSETPSRRLERVIIKDSEICIEDEKPTDMSGHIESVVIESKKTPKKQIGKSDAVRETIDLEGKEKVAKEIDLNTSDMSVDGSQSSDSKKYSLRCRSAKSSNLKRTDSPSSASSPMSESNKISSRKEADSSSDIPETPPSVPSDKINETPSAGQRRTLRSASKTDKKGDNKNDEKKMENDDDDGASDISTRSRSVCSDDHCSAITGKTRMSLRSSCKTIREETPMKNCSVIVEKIEKDGDSSDSDGDIGKVADIMSIAKEYFDKV